MDKGRKYIRVSFRIVYMLGFYLYVVVFLYISFGKIYMNLLIVDFLVLDSDKYGF